MDGRLEVQDFIQSIDSHKAFGVEYERCAGRTTRPIDAYEAIDYYRNTKTTALPELLQAKSISSSI